MIYTSEKVLPYVYICIHKETGEFYIGYKESNIKNNIPSHLDLPQYKTSSMKVKPRFEEFDWVIVAEFFDGKYAYDFEQQLIFENFESNLILNESCYYGSVKRFRRAGPHSELSKQKMSDRAKSRIYTKDHIERATNNLQKYRETHEHFYKGKCRDDETKNKISKSLTGRKFSQERLDALPDRNGVNNNFFGKHHSNETKNKISLTKSKLFDFCTSEGIFLENYTNNDIVEMFNLKRSTATFAWWQQRWYCNLLRFTENPPYHEHDQESLA